MARDMALMATGVEGTMAIRERLLISHPTLPLSASSIRRDLRHIHGEREGQNLCPHCGQALPLTSGVEGAGMGSMVEEDGNVSLPTVRAEDMNADVPVAGLGGVEVAPEVR